MSYTLGEAAKAVGFSKPTLSRAIKNGKLSAKRLDDGSYSIDPAELERWKDANGHRNGAVKRIATRKETPETSRETSALQDEVEKLRAQVQSDQRERGFLEQRIEDLKERAERAERKEDQLHALLVDQRPQATVEPRKGFWGRLFG
ncbi:helix-turn-helix domain-containing protein [Tritonibacter mobilis]|jgi:excisionase family DNA binding protein|uniref:helix-turn-helix domain-containing protein n=1 Tax=Tritonibacter mobilis TaxID=379347 RepID=UPI000E0D787E|nr:helix-turn-helix domain-containing protein [Tritonibacter mobilis]NHM20612.1 helix-turn-helix domain-containing protein [Tritonibacter mobilis]NHM25120.1 helix-turn-helix domain-containing protein [Tritonibacter mobilis]